MSLHEQIRNGKIHYMRKIITGDTQAAKDVQDVVHQNMLVRFALSGMKQVEFGEALHLTQASISAKFNRRTPWTIDDVANAAQVFGCEPADLMTDRVVREIAPKPEHDGSAAPAGARYFVRPEDGDGRNPGRNGRARAFVMPGATGWGSVPRVGLEPTLRRF